MRFEIPFDEVIHRKKIALNMKRLFGQRLILATICLPLGILLLYTDFLLTNASFFPNNAAGGFLLTYALLVYLLYGITKYRQDKMTKAYIYMQIPATTSIFELSDQNLHVKELRLETTMDLSLITRFEIIDGVAFLFPRMYRVPLMISEEEIGRADFKEIITLLQSKIKNGKGVAKYLSKG